MKNQRGITQGWLLGIIAVIGLMAITSGVTWRVASRYTESGWQAREATINAAAAAKIKAATDRVLDIQRAAGIQLAAVDSHYQDKLQEKDNALANARRDARTRGMFVNATCPPSGRDAGSGITAGSGVSDGPARVRLSDEDAEFLISEASRADKVVEQLVAAQEVIRQDRAACRRH